MKARDLVNKEVWLNASRIVDALAKHDSELAETAYCHTDYAEIESLQEEISDIQACIDLWESKLDIDNSDFDSLQADINQGLDDIDVLESQIQDLIDNPIEVLEHWIVSSYLADKLENHGEKIIDVHGHKVWCRTCSGQAIYIDTVIENITESINDGGN